MDLLSALLDVVAALLSVLGRRRERLVVSLEPAFCEGEDAPYTTKIRVFNAGDVPATIEDLGIELEAPKERLFFKRYGHPLVGERLDPRAVRETLMPAAAFENGVGMRWRRPFVLSATRKEFRGKIQRDCPRDAPSALHVVVSH